ncbi:hypothetical protein PPERSA_09587 [Pseudocohnilembus persalinus]|uniref:Uncharacterized protein n=1 Tax=Pseudocohnilembus persalinus TaxID=266149 RepID=A0A0V0QFR4_PSEPJ|nr:hypothetical protein PPERSA_09587 [Pseudocohnilembus persalinus]|eukprot:KRX00981.1 hypothetical protein PPERSA_09587 [Pseudocohnilembus persalinus]
MSDQTNQLKMRTFLQYCALTKFSKITQVFRKDKLIEIFKQTYIEDYYFTQIYVGKTDSKKLEHINCVHPLNYLLGPEQNSVLNRLQFERLEIELAVTQGNQMLIDNMHNASKTIEIYFHYENPETMLQPQINNNNNHFMFFQNNNSQNMGIPQEEAELDQKIYFMQKIRDPYFQKAFNNNNQYYGFNQNKIRGKNQLQQFSIDFEMYQFYFQQKQISQQYLQHQESTPYIVFDGILQKIIQKRQQNQWKQNRNIPKFETKIDLQQELDELGELDELEMEEEKIQIKKQISVQRENKLKLFNFFGTNNNQNNNQGASQNIEIENENENNENFPVFNFNNTNNQIELQQNLLQRNIQHQVDGQNPEWDGKVIPQRFIVKDYFGNSCLTILKKKFKQKQRQQRKEQKQQKLKKGGGFVYAKKGKNSNYYKKKSGKKSNLFKSNFY